MNRHQRRAAAAHRRKPLKGSFNVLIQSGGTLELGRGINRAVVWHEDYCASSRGWHCTCQGKARARRPDKCRPIAEMLRERMS
jgi:hypothetical protein